MMGELTEVFAGISGLILPVKNKSAYPQEFKNKSRLNYYSSLTNSIEFNSSFYKIPMPKTVEKWANDVPANFKFTFKLWREITHSNGLDYEDDYVKKFMDSINKVGNKSGCILCQFPPSFKPSKMPKLQNLIYLIKEYSEEIKWNIAVEIRHNSWYIPDFCEMLEKNDVALVFHDKSGFNFQIIDQDIQFVYLRFHGPGGNYKGSYSDDVLYQQAHYIYDWLAAGKRVYVYFNNTMGAAFENMETLKEMIRIEGER